MSNTAAWMSPISSRYIRSDVVEAVAQYAAARSKTGTIAWNVMLQCPVIEFSLKGDDPRLKAWQEGRLHVEPKECVILHYQKVDGGPFVAMDIEELGVGGLIDMLEKGDVMSGRGEYPNLMAAVAAVAVHNTRNRARQRADIKEASIERYKDMRRQIFDLPFVSVPDNIGAKAHG